MASHWALTAGISSSDPISFRGHMNPTINEAESKSISLSSMAVFDFRSEAEESSLSGRYADEKKIMSSRITEIGPFLSWCGRPARISGVSGLFDSQPNVSVSCLMLLRPICLLACARGPQ